MTRSKGIYRPRTDDPLTLVQRGESCWSWTGQINRSTGYGQFKRSTAHRAVYERLAGPIPSGLELDHLCRNHACVNPAHLEPVTHTENVRRGLASALRHLRTAPPATHCRNGHSVSENRIAHSNCRSCLRDAQRRYKARRKELAA